jgi:predicted ATP-dependent endonuclease of OLD family
MDAVDESGRCGDALAIVLVEGISDQVALETLAARRGRDLARERVRIVPIGVRRRSAAF